MTKPLKDNKAYHFSAPRYWPAWLLVCILYLLTKLPYRTQLFLGKHLGLLILKFNQRLKKIAVTNIQLCFPELSEENQKNLLKKCFISIGIAVFETGLAWFASDKKLKRLSHLHGAENLNLASQHGKQGILILGVHFTTLELIGRLFSMNHKLAVVYRAHKNPFVNHLIEKILKKHYALTIERNNVRGIFRAIKKGYPLWYTPDIDAGYYDHIFVPFFGIPAATLTAPARFALLTGVQTVLSTYYRRDDGTGYDMYISPPLEHFPSENLEADMTHVNHLVETAIRKKPEQYIWQYMRFKTRPNNEPRFYN